MNIFDGVQTTGFEAPTDTLGGGFLVDSGIHTATIKLAYIETSSDPQSKSMGLRLLLDVGGIELNQVIWFKGRDGKNVKPSRNDPKKLEPLQGYSLLDEISLLTTKLPLTSQTAEQKTVEIYDFEAKKKLPKAVTVMTSLLGKQVDLGIIRKKVDKTAKNSNTGKYEPTGEFREENEISKAFHHPSRLTTNEAREKKPSTFAQKFLDRYVKDGVPQVIDKTTKVAGNAGAPPVARGAAAAAATDDLFGE